MPVDQQPLSDQEFAELDTFLLSDHTSEECMTMDILHGFCTALAIGPTDVPFSEWLPHVWGRDTSAAPAFRDEKERAHIVHLIERFMGEIVMTLQVAPKEYEPLFCEYKWQGKTVLDAEGWAWGFYDGMHLRKEAWEAIHASPLAPLMRPFYLLGAQDLQPEEQKQVDNPAKVHQLALEIEAAIPQIHRYWLAQRKA